MTRRQQDALHYASADVRALNPELFGETTPAGKRKYGEHAVDREGMHFDSEGEYQRFRELEQLERAGIIRHLARQVKFTLMHSFTGTDNTKVRAVTFTADFVYQEGSCTVIEDFKSPATAKEAAFRIRWRLLQHKFRGQKDIVCRLSGADD